MFKLRTAACLLTLAIWPVGLHAQPKKESLQIKGTIKAAQGDIIHVGNETTSEWYVKLPADPQNIFLTGTALPNWLKPGMAVRFVAQFDAKGKAQDPVHKLEVFTPRKPREGEMPDIPGVFPTTAFGAGAGGDAPAGPGVGAAKPGPAAKAKDQGGTYKAVGQLTAVKGREFIVTAGQLRLGGELQKDVEISVNIGDYRYMKVGDAVEIGGFYYPPNLAQVQAERITIKAAQPLGTAEDEKPAKPGLKPRTDNRTKPKSKGKSKGTEDLPF